MSGDDETLETNHPKIRAITIIKGGGEELRKFIPINNSQKG